MTGMVEYELKAASLRDKKEEVMRHPFRDVKEWETFREELIELCGEDWPQGENDLTIDFAFYSRMIQEYPTFKEERWEILRIACRNWLERTFRKVLERTWKKYDPERDMKQGLR